MTIVTLLTDFGQSDPYVGVMKGIILGICPTATVIDLCHMVTPQNIAEGAFLLGTSWHYFPVGTIHVAVVDPGVGSGRRAVTVAIRGHTFVAPDNGLLTGVLTQHRGHRAQAVQLAERSYWLSTVSATFHGRDVFAPVAGHLACGVPLTKLGPAIPLSSLVRLRDLHPRRRGPTLYGRVIHVDRFGTLVTTVHATDLTNRRVQRVEIAAHIIERFVQTYADAASGEIVALLGSSGHLEIAQVNGHAAASLSIQVGTPVRVITAG